MALDRRGRSARRAWDRVPDLAAARRQPSLQLSGSPTSADLQPRAARGRGRPPSRSAENGGGDADRAGAGSGGGVRRLRAASPAHARPDRRPSRPGPRPMRRTIPAPGRRRGIRPSDATALDLAAAGIRSVVWATGYRRDYGWLRLPVLDRGGELAHHGGVTAVPGLYALGLPFLRRRSSTFIDGVGRDAEELAPLIAAQLDTGPRAPPDEQTDADADRARFPLRRRGRRRPLRRGGHRDAARPRRAPGCWWSSATQPGTDTLSTHALMRGGGDAARAAGACCRDRRGRHAGGAAHQLRLRRERVVIDIRASMASTRSMRRGARVLDPALVAAARRGGRRGPLRHRRPAACCASAAGRVAGRARRSTADRRRRDRAPASSSAPTGGARRSRARSVRGRACCRRARGGRGLCLCRGPGRPRLPLALRARPERRGDPDQRRAALRLRLDAAGSGSRRSRAATGGRAGARCWPRRSPALGAEVAAGRIAAAPGRLRRASRAICAEPRAGLGAGRRRGLLQGPDHRARHHRRAARRRDPGAGGAEGGAAALARYQASRDALSLPLFARHRRDRRARLGPSAGAGAAPGAEPGDEGRAGAGSLRCRCSRTPPEGWLSAC